MVLCKWTREFRDLLLGRTVAGVMVALSVVARMMAAKLRLMTPRPRGGEGRATGAKQKQTKATQASGGSTAEKASKASNRATTKARRQAQDDETVFVLFFVFNPPLLLLGGEAPSLHTKPPLPRPTDRATVHGRACSSCPCLLTCSVQGIRIAVELLEAATRLTSASLSSPPSPSRRIKG